MKERKGQRGGSASSFEHVELPGEATPEDAGVSSSPVSKTVLAVQGDPISRVGSCDAGAFESSLRIVETASTEGFEGVGKTASSLGRVDCRDDPADVERKAAGLASPRPHESGAGAAEGDQEREYGMVLEPEGHDAVRELEEAAEAVVETALEAAKDVGARAQAAAREAKQSLTVLAAGFSSWWNSLDEAPGGDDAGGSEPREGDAAEGDTGEGDAAGGGEKERVEGDGRGGGPIAPDARSPPASLPTVAPPVAPSYPSSPGDLIEAFTCDLVQAYESANGLTPPRDIAFRGVLSVFASALRFEVDRLPGRGAPPTPFVLAASEIAGALEGFRGGVAVRTRAGHKLRFSGFATDPVAEEALALIESISADARR